MLREEMLQVQDRTAAWLPRLETPTLPGSPGCPRLPDLPANGDTSTANLKQNGGSFDRP